MRHDLPRALLLFLVHHRVAKVFEAHGLRLFDVEELPTHGGSLRIYGCHADDPRLRRPMRTELLAREARRGLRRPRALHGLRAQGGRGRSARSLDFLIGLQARGQVGSSDTGRRPRATRCSTTAGWARTSSTTRVDLQPPQAGPPPAGDPHPDPLARGACARQAGRRPHPALEPAGRDHRAAVVTSASGAGGSRRGPRTPAVRVMFAETPLPGAWVIELEPPRGRARLLRPHLRPRGVRARVASTRPSCSAARHINARAGTLRGMHYQTEPHGEAEARALHARRGPRRDRRPAARVADAPALVRGRPHRRQRAALYVPVGMAHGFQTLEDGSEVLYMMGHEYVPEAASGRALGRPGVRDRVARAARGRAHDLRARRGLSRLQRAVKPGARYRGHRLYRPSRRLGHCSEPGMRSTRSPVEPCPADAPDGVAWHRGDLLAETPLPW